MAWDGRAGRARARVEERDRERERTRARRWSRRECVERAASLGVGVSWWSSWAATTPERERRRRPPHSTPDLGLPAEPTTTTTTTTGWRRAVDVDLAIRIARDSLGKKQEASSLRLLTHVHVAAACHERAGGTGRCCCQNGTRGGRDWRVGIGGRARELLDDPPQSAGSDSGIETDGPTFSTTSRDLERFERFEPSESSKPGWSSVEGLQAALEVAAECARDGDGRGWLCRGEHGGHRLARVRLDLARYDAVLFLGERVESAVRGLKRREDDADGGQAVAAGANVSGARAGVCVGHGRCWRVYSVE